MSTKWFFSCLLLLTSLGAQAGSNGSTSASCRKVFDFTRGQKQGFQAVFRDLPLSIYNEYTERKANGESLGPVAPLKNPPGSYPEDTTHWLLNSGIFHLPSPLRGTGFLVQGNNHSDDLDMFLVRQISGFRPDSVYQMRFRVDLAGNAPHGAIGVGGDPELRAQAFLATAFNPTQFRVDEDQNVRHLQSLSELPHAEVATNAVCDADSEIGSDLCPEHFQQIPYELKRGKDSALVTARTDAQGRFWLMVGTHSPFESFSGIYYTRIEMKMVRGPGLNCSMEPAEAP